MIVLVEVVFFFNAGKGNIYEKGKIFCLPMKLHYHTCGHKTKEKFWGVFFFIKFLVGFRHRFSLSQSNKDTSSGTC